MTNEITWDTFDERTRLWLRVLSNIPEETVVRELRLDLDTGVVTLQGAGGDRVLGVIGPGDGGNNREEFFTPLKSWSRDLPVAPIPYEPGYVHSIALAVYHSALKVLVGDLPLVWDDVDGLCWITDHVDESLDILPANLEELRDGIRRIAAECWAVEFERELRKSLPDGVYREYTPNKTRFLTGGRGSVEIIPAPDDDGLIDVNILDQQGWGLRHHLAYRTPEGRLAMDRAALFLNERYNKKENSSER